MECRENKLFLLLAAGVLAVGLGLVFGGPVATVHVWDTDNCAHAAVADQKTAADSNRHGLPDDFASQVYNQL